MERKEAIERMQALRGRNLHELAIEHNVTVLSPLGKVNKGWAVSYPIPPLLRFTVILFSLNVLLFSFR